MLYITWPSNTDLQACKAYSRCWCAAVWAVAVIFAFTFARAAAFANSFGIVPALLAVPVLYLLAGLAFSAFTVGAKRAILPKFETGAYKQGLRGMHQCSACAAR